MLSPTFVFINRFRRLTLELLLSSSTFGPQNAVDVGVLEELPQVGPV
jgi:hypothetical protein